MQEFDLLMIIAVFQEMLGIFLWPLALVCIFCVFSFIALLIYDRRIVYKRFLISLLFGVLGGFVGFGLLVWLSVSGFTDAEGPIDFLLIELVFIAGFLAGTIIIYTLAGWVCAFSNKEIRT